LTSHPENQALELGPDVIRHLIPHRRPFLMVDRVRRYERGPAPKLWAERYVSANEPVFEGHYPGLHLWPGVYTIEGLGQTSLLLEVLAFLEHEAEARGKTADDALAELRNLEHGYRLRPGFDPEGSELLRALGERRLPLAMSGSVEMKFVEPVFAGSMLEYQVTRHQIFEQRFIRVGVEARVSGKLVAKGTITGVTGATLHPNAPPH
jgi:3-hydroxyacyl-[acyl-carrier-protein] dehydratase